VNRERREPPRTRKALEQRIRNLAREGQAPDVHQQAENRLERAVLNTVVSQMVPEGVVKGGTAMKLRIGEAGSRFTPDFDAARARSTGIDDYLDLFADRLDEGWGGFSGRIEELDPTEPEGVPDDYIMRPFKLVLSYRGSEWRTRVTFELGHDEIGSTTNPEVVMSDQMRDIFARLGLPEPHPVPVLPVPHQVAQKLHACTGLGRDGTNERAHDLVDLQLLDDSPGIDVAETAPIARRLFAARKSHAWPPTVQAHPGWDELYAEAADGLGVLPTAADAVAWANELIARIDAALS
jgi:hypothetical protein